MWVTPCNLILCPVESQSVITCSVVLVQHISLFCTILRTNTGYIINPLKAELNPIRHLLALVGARHIVQVSRVRVKQRSEIGSCQADTLFPVRKKAKKQPPFPTIIPGLPKYNSISNFLARNICRVSRK